MRNLLPILFAPIILGASTLLAPVNGQGGSVNNAPGVFEGDGTIGTLPLEDGHDRPLFTTPFSGVRCDGYLEIDEGGRFPVLTAGKTAPWMSKGYILEGARVTRRSFTGLSVFPTDGGTIDLDDSPAWIVTHWRKGTTVIKTWNLWTRIRDDETEPEARARLAREARWIQKFQKDVIP